MDISILIPNHSDLRMYRMIQSIDYYDTDEHHVELVIVLNKPTKEVLDMVELVKKDFGSKFKFNIVNITHCNLGLAYNEGIKHATYSNILFIDTDLICGKNAIQQVVNAAKDVLVVKARLIYQNMNGLVEKSRLVNTTEVEPPYIPVILIKKEVFHHLKDDYMFAVDTVWCSDAEFANRVLRENISIRYIGAKFYHDRISVKKDIKDAFLYGLGKGIRVKRTKENWQPMKEIWDMYKNGRKRKIGFIANAYSVLWITLQQIACLVQQFTPILFKESISFEKSASIWEEG